ncbi:MAG: helix-turn-helix domain-containing protein [Sphingomonadales bacterium]|nr:helix-turn-helix domain-containing protein [Sphingomonadales bacterium]
MITPAQCRAARALLKWKQEELAARASVGVSSVRTFEVEKTTPHNSTLRLLKETFEKAGVEFIAEGEVPQHPAGAGVRLKE